MTGRTYASVWDAIENTSQEAASMKIRSRLMMALKAHIKESKMAQTTAAHLFGVTQPRISDLMRGKIDLFSLESLVDMATHAGLEVELNLKNVA